MVRAAAPDIGPGAVMDPAVGAFFFGLVIGWVTHRTLRKQSNAVVLGDIAAVIGAVGGGAVVAIYTEAQLFSSYAVGLACGFFGYLIVAAFILKDNPWLSTD